MKLVTGSYLWKANGLEGTFYSLGELMTGLDSNKQIIINEINQKKRPNNKANILGF